MYTKSRGKVLFKCAAVSVSFTCRFKPTVEALRRDKHKSGGGRWAVLSEFDTGSINEEPPVALVLHLT